MFVITTKYTGTNHIVNCVKSIRKWHPSEEILVVDSASDDKSYFELVKPYNVAVADVNNRNYTTGALHHAYYNYPREYYYSLQDSMELETNLDYCKDFMLSTWAWFYIKTYGFPEEDWARKEILKYTNFTIPSAPDYGDECGIAGGLTFCHRKVLDDLYSSGFEKILEDTKDRNGAMERLHGIALTQLGYNIKENSIWGNWHGARQQKILKTFLARQ